MKSMLVTHTTGQTDSVPKMAKDEAGDNCGEGNSHGNLRNPFHGMEDLKTAIDYYESLLRTAKLVGDKAGEGSAYRYLGIAYGSLKDFKTAIDYHEGHLKTTQEVGDKAEEGGAYANLGHDYYLLGDFKTAVEYHEQQIRIAKEVEDRAVEGNGYGRLGKDYEGLGDFKTAIKYHKRCLKIGKEAGDKAIEGLAYVNLGFNYQSLGDFKTAVDCYERSLKIAKEAGDNAGEERAYNNLGAAYRSLGEFETAFDYHQLSLKIAKEVADKAAEGNAYCNLGNVYQSRGDFKTAVDYYERYLNICKEVGDRAGEGGAYNNLGSVYQSQDDFKRAIEYHEHELEIAKEVGSKALKGTAYANLGMDYLLLGYYETSVKYHECHLQIAKELGDRDGEGKGYSNLGIAYQSLGNFEKAFECNEQYLTIAKEIGDKAGEGKAYGNLGFNFHELGDFKTAIDCFKRSVEIAKEVGDRVAEGKSYGHLGRAYGRLGDLKIAIEYHECCIEIAKEVGNKIWAASSFHDLGRLFESQRSFSKAIDCFHSSVTMLDIVRRGLQEGKDEWKISYRNTYEIAYTSLWRLLLKQDKVVEALLTAEQGRSQALNDLMEFNYGLEPTHRQFDTHDESAYDSFSLPPSVSAFIAIDEQAIVFWVVQEGKDVELRKKEVSHDSSLKLNDFIQSLIAIASQEIGVRAGVKCEDRSLDNLRDEHMANERATETPPTPVPFQMNTLKTLYDAIIEPIADLVLGDELILVPEGPLCLAPYAAFVDSNSRYLCDICRIRVIPSLTSLKLITDSPAGYHSKTGVLLVGDPWVQEVVIPGVKLEQLPFARKEVQMIGRICNTKPLIGREATKDEVLRRLSSVALIHIAAHGRMETGEIVLAPNTTRTSHILTKEDFFLTMKDVTSAQIRARLVVLSCCHSGRGEVKAEGVVGIARAFLGAGARAVLVTLWAIDDEATLQFMSIFYSHLVKGISASESLNKAMKRMRESDQFNEVKHWAPFVLIGDDVTMEFDRIE